MRSSQGERSMVEGGAAKAYALESQTLLRQPERAHVRRRDTALTAERAIEV
jgi:hypothetical protein